MKEEKLGEDIIKMYKPYENKTTVWKKNAISNQVFELPDYYEVISLSKYLITQSELGPTERSLPLSTTALLRRLVKSPPWLPLRK